MESKMSDPPPATPAPAPQPGLKFSRINLTVLGVLFVFGYIYYVAVFCVIIPWLSYSVPGVGHSMLITVTTALSLYCYLFCVLLDPGSVPVGWHPDDEEQKLVQEVKKKNSEPRFCQKCCRLKPPRSHHCRVCQRCVLRMDHHCPWTNNCIGHANYKAFLLFLIYVNAALVHAVGLLVAHALHTLASSAQGGNWTEGVIHIGLDGRPTDLRDGLQRVWVWVLLQLVAFAAALPLTIGLIMLLGWHVNLIITNKTTIEYQEGVTARIKAVSTGEDAVYQHPYNLGLLNNLHSILGDNGAAWPLPPCAGRKHGTDFPTVWDVPSTPRSEARHSNSHEER